MREERGIPALPAGACLPATPPGWARARARDRAPRRCASPGLARQRPRSPPSSPRPLQGPAFDDPARRAGATPRCASRAHVRLPLPRSCGLRVCLAPEQRWV